MTLGLSTPSFKIVYRGVDQSGTFQDYVKDITYTDRIGGAASALEVRVRDERGLWQGDLLPLLGDTIQFEIFYTNSLQKLAAGLFQIDDLEFSLAPDVVTLSGLSTPFIGSNIRQKRNMIATDVTLLFVIQGIANTYGLTLTGDVPAFNIGRIEQNNQSDLDFLAQLSADYGTVFKIENGFLVFTKQSTLEANAPILTLNRNNYKPGTRFRQKSADTYQYCYVEYTDSTGAAANTTVSTTRVTNGQYLYYKSSGTRDTLAQAQYKGQEQLRLANNYQVSGEIGIIGDPRFVTAVNVYLEDVGRFSGKFQIEESVHTLSKEGWSTNLKVRRIS